LSRGLQLLQSKISVLEDLSDRTEVQVRQLNTLMEQKAKFIDEKIAAADKKIANIDHSIEKSLEVAEIFQDRIPHKEIIERQSLSNYVRAARMAHEGHSVEEIAKVIDLPVSEINFIAKVNRDRLLFAEEDLPPWAHAHGAPVSRSIPNESTHSFTHSEEERGVLEAAPASPNGSKPNQVRLETQSNNGYSQSFTFAEEPGESLAELGRRFREACAEHETKVKAKKSVSSQMDVKKQNSVNTPNQLANFTFDRFNPNFLLTKIEEKMQATSQQDPDAIESSKLTSPIAEMSDNF
jgi:hypothetical protein